MRAVGVLAASLQQLPAAVVGPGFRVKVVIRRQLLPVRQELTGAFSEVLLALPGPQILG